MSEAEGKRPRSAHEWERDRHCELAAHFAKHEIRERSADGTRWLLRGESSNLWCEVVVLRNALLVYGDFEPCIFARSSYDNPIAVVRWMGQHRDFAYVCEKASIGMGGDADVEARNAEVLRAGIMDRMESWEDRAGVPMPDEIREALDEAMEACEDYCNAHECDRIAEGLYDVDAIDSEELASLGYAATTRVLRAHAAVARLWEILKAEGATP